MIIRTASIEDWDMIQKLSEEQDYPMPSFKQLASAKVIEENGKVIAFACMERKLEASIMLDFYQSLRTQVKALKLLNTESIVEVNRLSHDSIYAFVKNEGHAKLLQKHFGYKPIKGSALILEIK